MIYLRFLYIFSTLLVAACGVYEPFSKASLSPSPSGSPSVAINRFPDEPSSTPTATETPSVAFVPETASPIPSVTPSESVSPTPSPSPTPSASPSPSVTPTMTPDQRAQLVKDIMGIKPCSSLADLEPDVVKQLLATKPGAPDPVQGNYEYVLAAFDGADELYFYTITFDKNNLIWWVSGEVPGEPSTRITDSWFCSGRLTQK